MRDQGRETEVLDAVVRLNIETGRPVSSQLVARLLRGAYSPATIRAVMKQLERDGFLVQPHASGGRLPTDRGFRAFVDRILAAWRVHPWEAPRRVQRMVRSHLQSSVAAGNTIRVLARLLSQLSANIGIILGPSWESLRVERVDLYPKEGRRVLMVVVLENALVRSGQFTLADDFPPVVTQEAARLLSERVSGLSVAEIRSQVLPLLNAASSPASRCACDLAERGRGLFAEAEEGEVEVQGVDNLLSKPEFSEPGSLKALIRFIESPRSIREALRFLDRETSRELGIWIGRENPIGELRTFSLLSSPISIDGRRGVLAVLGPRRMPYPRVFSGIDVIRSTLNSMS